MPLPAAVMHSVGLGIRGVLPAAELKCNCQNATPVDFSASQFKGPATLATIN